MDLKLYSWNVNGIRANLKRGSFNNFLSSEDPDIICLQETRLSESINSIPEIKNYHQYWASSERPGYSGTAILTKLKPISTFSGFTEKVQQKYHSLLIDSYGDTTKEGRLITAEYENFWVVSVYTPNSKPDLSRLALRYEAWDPAFKEHISELEKIKPVFASGDFNVAHEEIDLANPKANKGKHGFTNEEREGFTKLLNAGVTDTFRKLHPTETNAYSWWSHFAKSRERNVGWRIDYWLISNSVANNLKTAAIHPSILGSDHCPVSIIIKEVK